MDPVRKVQDFFEAVDSHDIDSILAQVTDDVVFENNAVGITARGAEEVADLYRDFFAGFPDLEHEINPVASDTGDKVFVEGVVKGTMKGEFGGHAPTGKRVASPFLTVFEFRDGTICEWRAYYDNETFMGQILE